MYADLHRSQSRKEKAEKFLLKLLEMKKSKLGADDSEVFKAKMIIAGKHSVGSIMDICT